MQSAQAAPSTWEDEFDYFLKYGSHSKNFYANFMENRDEETKETILNLQNQEKKNRLCTEEEKQEAVKTWRGLSEQINSDTPFSILYLSKMLKIQWDGEVAIALANKCHELAQIYNDPKVRIKLAYRGFATLGVKLTEPDFDYHKKLRAGPSVIRLLEDLKKSTESIKSVSDLPLPLSDVIFHKDCIPQAQVCSLLTVAYGAYILEGLSDTNVARYHIYNNGKDAITLYQEGLQGLTTPDQREYYHKQIVNLVIGLTRTPELLSTDDDQYLKVMKKSSLALARTFKDAHKESEDLLVSTELTYKMGSAYYLAGKKESALKCIGIVRAVSPEESERGQYISSLKTRAENLRLQIEDPSKALTHQAHNWTLFERW